MVDTMLGTNDGAPFRVNEQALLSDTVFYQCHARVLAGI